MPALSYSERHPEIIPWYQGPFTDKILTNQRTGYKILKKGDFAPFEGWPEENSENIFDFTLIPDEASWQQIQDRVVKPLQGLAQKHNIKAIYAGNGDLISHICLQPSEFTNLSQIQVNTTSDYLLSNRSHLNMVGKILSGHTTFHLDTLVMGRTTSYICASRFSEEQVIAFRARKTVGRIINRIDRAFADIEGNFASLDYDTIFHSSIMRYLEVVSKEGLIAFVEEACLTVGKEIKKDPILITIDRVYRGSARVFQETKDPSDLFKLCISKSV